ncbi:MAG: T9SS type A sorting domain-containing protein [bacterium]
MIIITTQVVKCGLVITNPVSSYRPLPDEILEITWNSEYGSPVNLYYKTDIETDWTLISKDNVNSTFTFQCPTYFFDYIEFKVIQNVPMPPKLIWEETCDGRTDITYGEFSPNGKSLAICSKDGFIDAYSINNRTKYYQSAQYDNGFYHIAYIATDEILHSKLITAIDSSIIQTTNLATSVTSDFISYKYFDDQGVDVDNCAKTYRTVIALMKTPNLLIINNLTKAFKHFITLDSADIYSVCFSESGDKIYIGDYNGFITVIDTNLNLLTKFAAHGNGGSNNPIWGIDCSYDGKRIASCGVDGFVKVWKAGTYELIHEFKHDFHVRDVAFDKNSENVLSASLDKSIKEWNIASGLENFSLDYKAQALSANYSITGDTIIGTGRDNRFMVWEKQKPLVLLDSIKLYSDYIAEIYIPDIQSKPGATIEVPLLMSVNPRYTKKGVNIEFISSAAFPNRLLNIYEYNYPKKNLYDVVAWNILKEIKSGELDKKLGLTLVGDVPSDSMKLTNLILIEPKGAKFTYHGGLLTILNQCTESTFRLVNISDSNNTIFINNNTGSFDIFINNEEVHKNDISIYNISGYSIPSINYSFGLKNNSINVDVSNFASGIYFVVLHNNGLYIVKKIIIHK